MGNGGYLQAIDGTPISAHHFGMTCEKFRLASDQPRVAGSLGSSLEMAGVDAETARISCDIVEIRLDLLADVHGNPDRSAWSHLDGLPLLFTARRIDEGGALPLDPATRMELLRSVLDQAALIDIEVASIGEMGALIQTLGEREIPWIASYHDFSRLPDNAALVHAARLAKIAGASAFKVAARLHSPADLARLAEFQLEDHGLPVSTMGMGALAAVSRLLCAQCGSVLNYGFLGKTATAPGQWDSSLLKTAVSKLPRFTA